MALIDQILPQNLAPQQLARLPKRFQPLYQQAYGEAYLRAAPQASGLLALLDEAKGSYQQRLAQNQAAADLISNSALSAQRNMPAQLQSPTNPLYSMLGQHAVTAAEAAKYQNTAAQNEYDSTAGKISGQLGDLGQQTGAYFSTRAADLVGADRKSRHDTNMTLKGIQSQFALQNQRLTATAAQDQANRRNQRAIAAGHDATSQANTQKRIDAQANKPKGPKLATPQQHGAFQDKVNAALAEATPLMKAGGGRNQVGSLLVSGAPTSKNAKGQTIQGVKAQPQLIASVALDLLYDGHVSRRNLNELHRRGLSVKKLGFPTVTSPKAAVQAVQKVGL